MKTINEFRSTNKFCITGNHLDHFARIVAFFEKRNERVEAIANEDESCEYTVRVSSDRGVFDHRIVTAGCVCIHESYTVCDFSAPMTKADIQAGRPQLIRAGS